MRRYKYVSLLMSALLFMTLIPKFVIAEENTLYTREIEVIAALDILKGKVSESEPLTQIALVQYSLALKNIEIFSFGLDQYFEDVPPENAHYSVVNAAVKSGIVKNVGARFQPDRLVTVAEAAVMLMNVMGYDIIAESAGGSQAHYLSVARQYGFLNGVKGHGEVATYGQFARMVYNTFTIGVLEQHSAGARTEYRISQDDSSLSFHGLRKGEGIIVENDVSSIYYSSSAAPRGKVLIDDKYYDEGQSEAGRWLGYNVEFYYEYGASEDGPIKYAIPYLNDEYRVDLEESYIAVSDTKVTVFDMSGKSIQSMTISPKSCIIQNGKSVPYDTSLLTRDDVEVLFVESRRFDGYSMIFIEQYKNDVVTKVDAKENLIYTKYYEFGNTGYIDLSDRSVRRFYIYKNGEPAEINDIKPGDVVSIAASEDMARVIIQVSDKKVYGDITGYSLEENGFFTVYEEQYKPAYDFQEVGKLSKSLNVTLFLNFKGQIVDFIASANKNYAFILGAKKDNGISKGGKLRLLLASGATTIVDLAPKVDIGNAITVKADDLIETLIEEFETNVSMIDDPISASFDLIVYGINGKGQINKLIKARPPSGNAMLDEDDFVLSRTISSPTPGYYKYQDVGLNENTLFFHLDFSNGFDEDYFSIIRGVDVYQVSGTVLKMYDAELTGFAKVGLIIGAGRGIISESTYGLAGLSIVTRITKALKPNGTIGKKLYLTKSGNELGYFISETVSCYVPSGGVHVDIDDLSFGDIIIFEQNGAGEIVLYRVIYRHNVDHNRFAMLVSAGAGRVASHTYTVYNGMVRYIDENMFTLSLDGGLRAPMVRTSLPAFYICDTKNKKITKGSLEQLTAENFNNGQPGDIVVTRSVRTVLNEVILYK